jgi:EmrB/QacA subfamily drug resistance transporter
MLVNGVLIPITAFLMERFTTRQLFLASMILFAAGTLICGVAPGFSLLITGRVVQAAGAGIMLPLLTNVILSIYPVEKRGSAMGLIGIAMIFAPAIGPTLSGWIVENYSWRLLFFIVLPIAIIDIIIASIFLKNVTERTFPKIDLIGVSLSTLGFGGILYSFSSAGNDGWGSPVVITTMAVGIVSLTLFIWRQLKAKKPMLEFRVFKYGMFTLTTIINVVLTMAMFSAMILVPIYLQNIRGFSPVESGLLLLPGAILMGIMSPITGKIFDKIGARWLAVTGLAITVVTTFEFSNLTDSTSYTFLIVMYSFRMFGLSMLMMPIMTAGLNELPNSLNAHGTAMVNTIRQVSGAIGTALLVTVFTNQTADYFKTEVTSGSVNPQDKSAMTHALMEAKIQGINDAFIFATGLALLGLILAFFIRKNKRPNTQKNTAEQKNENKLAVND